MRLKVYHKGLIIVITPLLIELILIGFLYYLVVLTDKQQTQAAKDRRMAILSAQMVFSNIHDVTALNLADTDSRWHSTYLQQTARTRNSIATLASLEPVRQDAQRSIVEKLVEAENFTMETLDKIAEIKLEGFSLGNIYRLLAVEDKACLRLADAHALFSQFYTNVNNAAKKGQQDQEHLYQTVSVIVLLGVILNLSAAFILMLFFRKNFLFPLSVIRDNVGRIEKKAPLNAPLKGTDELCDLDRSFHEMNRQLLLATEREKALFDNTSDIICILDEELKIVRINRATEMILGYSPDELAGTAVLDRVIPQEGQQSVVGELADARAGDRAGTFESEFETKSGQTRNMMWSAIWTEKQKCWYCILHDISEQKEIERAQRDLTRLIASEFEQPLLHMSSQLKQIGSGELGEISETMEQKVERAARSVPRLVKLVGDLLQIEHLQGEDITIDHRVCSVSELLEDACRDVEAVAQRNNISIVRQCDVGQWQVDEGKLTRVLVNLLSNAIKFSPENSTIKLVSLLEGDTVLTQVSDQGRGIPESVLPTLFQPFKQVESNDGKRGVGSGLGLVICKRIVEQHGGEIGVESEAGHGSTFWFRIPVNKAAPRQPEQAEKAADQPVVKQQEQLKQATAGAGKSSFWGGWNLRRKGLALIAVPLIFELIFVAGMLGALLQGESDVRRQIHDRELAAPLMNLVLNLAEVSYLIGSISRDPHALDKLEQLLHSMTDSALLFENATQGDPQAKKVADDFLPSVVPLARLVQQVITLSRQGRLAQYQTWQVSGQVLHFTENCASRLEQLLALLEDRHRDAIENQARSRSLLLSMLTGGLVINVATAIALAALFSRDVVRRLKFQAENSKRFAEHLPLSPPLPGNDEIARLDLDFHATADRIAEQRAKERAFLDNARSIICALDQSGIFLTTNPATEQILHLPAEQLARLSLFDLLDDKESAHVAGALEEAKKTDLSQQFETSLRVEERSVDLLWSISWSPTERGYYCVAHDITARKNLERLKKQFIAIMSHDLRSPITTISGVSVLALHGAYGTFSQEVRSAFLQIKDASECIVNLVNDILDLEKLESGMLDLHTENVSLNSILSGATELVRYKELGIAVEVPEPGIQIAADADRLKHAIAVLLDELMKCGPSEMRITAQQSDVVSLNLAAERCLSDNDIMDSLVDRTHGAGSTSESDTSGRVRMPLTLKVIEAHKGHVTASRAVRDVTIKISFSK